MAGSKVSYPGWYDTNGTAAQSRANLVENVLSPSAVAKVKYLRSVIAPMTKPGAPCRTQNIVAPVPAGGYLYAVTSGKVSKYDPATGKLLWRHAPPTNFGYESLAISGNILVAGAYGCGSASEPPGLVTAYNAATGKRLWVSGLEGLYQAAIAGKYVVMAAQDAVGYLVSVVNLSNGAPVWGNSDGGFTDGPVLALVVGQLVIWYDQDGMVASNLATGATVWSLPGQWTGQMGDLSGPTGKHLYATSPAGTVQNVDPQTGKLGYVLNQAVTVVAVDLSRVYATCGTQGQNLCAYNISTGALEWQDNGSAALAAEADGVLYLDSGAALNAATGKLIKFVWSSTSAASAIAVGNGRIAVVTDPRVLDLYGLKGS
jgi:hypothetical protein